MNHFYGTLLLKKTIKTNGIKANSYWAEYGIAEYYAETIEDEGDEAVFIQAPMSAFDVSLLKPDRPGIEEPITTVIEKDEEEIWEEWEKSNQTWQDSLEIIGSVRYDGIITLPPARIE